MFLSARTRFTASCRRACSPPVRSRSLIPQPTSPDNSTIAVAEHRSRRTLRDLTSVTADPLTPPATLREPRGEHVTAARSAVVDGNGSPTSRRPGTAEPHDTVVAITDARACESAQEFIDEFG